MLIGNIIENIEYISLHVPTGLGDIDIKSICQDSRKADDGCIFFCRKGSLSDGHKYARQAYDRGARFFVIEHEVDLPDDAATVTVTDSGAALRRLSPIFYEYSPEAIRIIGITGTKGKTTIALSVYNIAKANGIKVGYIGTNGVHYGDMILETANTTPDSPELYSTLRDMRSSGITDVVIEVSSQALWQKRTEGLKFEICAFTNLYEDHIGGVEHPDMEHYKSCKKLLFTDYGAKNIIINSDSPSAEYMVDGAFCERIIRTSASGVDSCDIYAENIYKHKRGVRPGVAFDLLFKDKSLSEKSDCGLSAFIPIPGIYSVENGLLTIAICSLMGMSLDNILYELSRLCIPGRFESVELEGRPDSLFVIDYAHNGASLSAVLASLRQYEPERIIVLFGSVGGRTQVRREELGRAADAGADVIIVTSDNPNFEDPMQVINDINAAISNRDKQIYLIPDRAEAIKKAYDIAQSGDFILLAGKGHESYQLVCGEKVPFSERKILEELDSLSPSYM